MPALYWPLRAFREWLRPQPPAHLQRCVRPLAPEQTAVLRQALLDGFLPAERAGTPEGRADLENHLHARLAHDRRYVVPWLDSIRPLQGLRILEIGCGTGSSTVALAEQGAAVAGLDLDAAGLRIAEQRLRLYDLPAELFLGNAESLPAELSARTFDVVVFYASLEHMLYAERIAALRRAWELLPAGGLLAVIEAPNRLWYYDHHTSHLNFFFWLPEELAVPYAQFSPRASLCAEVAGGGAAAAERLQRAGRGVSYHELELALGPLPTLPVAGCLDLYWRQRDLALRLRWRFTRDGAYERLLRRLAPELHPAYLQPQLNLALRKT